MKKGAGGKSDLHKLLEIEKDSRDRYFHQLVRGESVIRRTEKSRQQIENEDLEQDIKLKKYTLLALFIFLVAETGLIFWFSYMQALNKNGFILEEWSFKLLITATILQITFMLKIAVEHLFPKK